MMVIVEGGSNFSVLEFNTSGACCLRQNITVCCGEVMCCTTHSTMNVRLLAYINSVSHLRNRDKCFRAREKNVRRRGGRVAEMPEAKGSNRKRKLSGVGVGGWVGAGGQVV